MLLRAGPLCGPSTQLYMLCYTQNVVARQPAVAHAACQAVQLTAVSAHESAHSGCHRRRCCRYNGTARAAAAAPAPAAAAGRTGPRVRAAPVEVKQMECAKLSKVAQGVRLSTS